MDLTPEEFDALPPSLRRKWDPRLLEVTGPLASQVRSHLQAKLFSNLERFRLDQLRLAQSEHYDRRSYRSTGRLSAGPAVSAVSRSLSITNTRPLLGSTSAYTPRSLSTNLNLKVADHQHHECNKSTTSRSGLQKRKRVPRRLRKRKSIHVAYLIAQADAQWFRSLPSKVQRRQFSEEEQARLASWSPSPIIDAADRALYRRGHHARHSLGSFSYPSLDTSSLPSMPSSPRLVDSGIGMDSSFYDSFRWLDEEEDIDLSLDEYHTHLSESSPTAVSALSTGAKRPGRRKLSLHKALSFSPLQLDTITSNRCPATSQSSNVPPTLTNAAPTTHQRSNSRPKSSGTVLRHVAQGSVSSIDHPAQHYQDPEARLKLRVYLASPQKFDEAIEFGFPSLDRKEILSPKESPTEPSGNTQETARTFLADDGVSILGEIPPKNQGAECEFGSLFIQNMFSPLSKDRNEWRPSSSSKLSTDLPVRPFQVCPSTPENPTVNREMTLKMTLTRADLRTAGSTSPLSTDKDDPLKLADLPPVTENYPGWDSPTGEASLLRRMWRKFRRR